MPVRELANSDVVTIAPGASLVEAAQLMRENHVSELLVCQFQQGVVVPVGSLSDRDIVIGALAIGVNLDSVCVEDIMLPIHVTIEESMGVFQAIQMMESYGLRELPVVDQHQGLVGVLSAASLLEYLGQELWVLSKLPARQKSKELELRP